MSERKWTEDQKSAIYAKWIDEEHTKRGNILVNAAAGSGKTAVLVERIIKKLIPELGGDEATDVSRLLVVTFTNAAAGEMQERISKALSDELTKAISDNDYKKQKFLKKQLSLMGSADITTIDAFCLKTIRSFFHVLNIDPDFSIMDSSELEIVKDDAMEKLFEEMYEEADDDFMELACHYTDGRDDKQLSEKIKYMYNFIQSFPEPEEWLEEKCEMFLNPAESEWVRIAMERVREKVSAGISELEKAAKIILESTVGISEDFEALMLKMPPCEPNDVYLGWGSYYTAIFNEYFNMKKMLDSDWNGILKLLDNGYISLRQKAVYTDKEKQIKNDELKEQIKKLRDSAKDICIKGVKKYISMPFEEMEDILKNKIYRTVSALSRMTIRFSEIYNGMKADRNVMEFSDVEHLCYRLFADHQEVREEFKAHYEEILMDEYQDSNRLQDELFRLISRGDNIFMVGDMKQSIYRFRNSDPTVFKEKSDLYEKSETAENRKIVLGKNFRSRHQVLDSINDVFELIMSEKAGGIDYDEDQRLNTGDDTYEDVNEEYRSECIVIEQKSAEETDIIDKARLEARVIAKRIRSLKDNGFLVRDSETKTYIHPETGEMKSERVMVYRELRNKDITILMSSYKNVADIYVEELSKAGIDCYAESSGYFERNEIKLVMALLKVIGNPYQDIPLLGVMRSPIGGFTDDDLVNIRLACGGYIYSAAKKLVRDYEGNEISHEPAKKTAVKTKAFLERLDRWRGYVEYMSSDKLLWTLYEETDIYGFVGALYGGEESQANLRLLFERARKYENTGYKGLFNFVRYIGLLKKKDKDLSTASMVTMNHDVVRIMTIHKSKGLEFPVVFLAGCGKEFNSDDGGLILHRDLGLGVDYVNFEKSIKIPGIAKLVIADSIREENISEEIRKLYVALTRAKEKLIVTATVDNSFERLEELKEEYGNTDGMDSGEVLAKKHYIDWIIPASIKNAERWVYKPISYADAVKEEYEEEFQIEKKEKVGRALSPFMNYQYPYKDSSDIPSKVSVSEIKQKRGESSAATYMIPEPEFLRADTKVKGAARGTVIHYVMQNIPFAETMDDTYVREFIGKLETEGRLLSTEVAAIDVKAITAFYNGPLGLRMRKSSNVFREAAFETEIPADMVSEEYPKEEKVILQGIIDCYFEEDGEIVLVDYKSDYYENEEEIKQKYTMQIELYADAIEKITEKKVKNRYLYLFFDNNMLEL